MGGKGKAVKDDSGSQTRKKITRSGNNQKFYWWLSVERKTGEGDN